METINPESQNILVWALTGSVLSGTWLAYKLNLFKFLTIININDEKKILLPSFLFLFSPFLVPFIFSHYMLSQSPNMLSQSSAPGSYVILSALVSGIILLTSNFINNKFQLEREEQQRIWQEKSDQQKWYREKIYDCYRTAAQLVPQILKEYSDIKINQKLNNIVSEDKHMSLLKLTSEFSCEFALLIAGHPDKNSIEFKEKTAKIHKSLNEEPWKLLPLITEMMEEDSRIKNINK
jgi:hypothetical protein